jgi:hypothetical protein
MNSQFDFDPARINAYLEEEEDFTDKKEVKMNEIDEQYLDKLDFEASQRSNDSGRTVMLIPWIGYTNEVRTLPESSQMDVDENQSQISSDEMEIEIEGDVNHAENYDVLKESGCDTDRTIPIDTSPLSPARTEPSLENDTLSFETSSPIEIIHDSDANTDYDTELLQNQTTEINPATSEENQTGQSLIAILENIVTRVVVSPVYDATEICQEHFSDLDLFFESSERITSQESVDLATLKNSPEMTPEDSCEVIPDGVLPRHVAIVRFVTPNVDDIHANLHPNLTDFADVNFVWSSKKTRKKWSAYIERDKVLNHIKQNDIQFDKKQSDSSLLRTQNTHVMKGLRSLYPELAREKVSLQFLIDCSRIQKPHKTRNVNQQLTIVQL